jgi:hypothetical protein
MVAPASPHLDVILPDGQVYHLAGRAARMVVWIARQAATIEMQNKGRLDFSFAGTSVVPELTLRWEPVEER